MSLLYCNMCFVEAIVRTVRFILYLQIKKLNKNIDTYIKFKQFNMNGWIQ